MDEVQQRRFKQIMAVHRAETEQLNANLKKSVAQAGKCVEEVVVPTLQELAAETAKYGLRSSVVLTPSPALVVGDGEAAFEFRVLLHASVFGARATYRGGFANKAEEKPFLSVDHKATLSLAALTSTLITEAFLMEFEVWLRTQLPTETSPT